MPIIVKGHNRDVDYVPSLFSFKDDKKDLITAKARQTRPEHRRKGDRSWRKRKGEARFGCRRSFASFRTRNAPLTLERRRKS